MRSRALIVATFLAVSALIMPMSAWAQRGSFGRSGGSFGGGRSFGGGSSRPSFGGGSSRSTFGGGSSRPTFGGSSSSRSGFGGSSSSSSNSFGRSGAFGGAKGNTFSQSRGGSPYRASAPPVVNPPVVHNNTFINYGGYGGGYTRMYGGWSDYSYSWVHPAWYFYTPFHPAFYYNPPVYVNGYYEPGGFSFFKFLLSIAVIGGIVWVIVKIATIGRGNRYNPPPSQW